MAAILLILCAKGVHKVLFLLQYLQVEHDDGKDRKAERQQVSVQQQDTDIHEVKAEERRVTAKTVNAGRDQLRFILVGDTRPPTILHAQNGQQEDGIAQYPDAEAGEPRACGKMAPAESDGEKLCNGRTQRRNAHQHFDRVNRFFLSAPDLPGLDAALLLRQYLSKINAVERRQHKKCQCRIGKPVFQRDSHVSSVLFGACIVQYCIHQYSKSPCSM